MLAWPTRLGVRPAARRAQSPISDDVRGVQGCIVLNLSWLNGYRCNMEAQELRDPNGIEFRGIESWRDSTQCMDQCTVDRVLPGGSKASAGAGFPDPHKVPSGLANHGVKDFRSKLLDLSPVLANSSLKWLHAIRQDTTLAQENGMLPHGLELLGARKIGTESASLSVEAVLPGAEPGCRGISVLAWPEAERLGFRPK